MNQESSSIQVNNDSELEFYGLGEDRAESSLAKHSWCPGQILLILCLERSPLG